MLEQVQLALAGTRQLGQALQLRFESSHLAIRSGTCLQALEVRRGAYLIEHLQLCACKHELSVLVLAVKRDQTRSQLAQVCHRGGATVEKGTGAPVRADPPCQHQLQLLCLSARAHVLGQALNDLGAHRLGHREDALDIGLLGAGAHYAGARAASHQ